MSKYLINSLVKGLNRLIDDERGLAPEGSIALQRRGHFYVTFGEVAIHSQIRIGLHYTQNQTDIPIKVIDYDLSRIERGIAYMNAYKQFLNVSVFGSGNTAINRIIVEGLATDRPGDITDANVVTRTITAQDFSVNGTLPGWWGQITDHVINNE